MSNLISHTYSGFQVTASFLDPISSKSHFLDFDPTSGSFFGVKESKYQKNVEILMLDNFLYFLNQKSDFQYL